MYEYIAADPPVYVSLQGPVLPGHHAIERYLIEDQLDQLLHIHHIERKDR